MNDPSSRGDPGAAPSYAAASAELERILQELESGQADVDTLADKVERAASLLAVCRQRLAATATKVATITAEVSAAMDADARAAEPRERS